MSTTLQQRVESTNMIWTLKAVRDHATEVYGTWDPMKEDDENEEKGLAAGRVLHYLDKLESELEKTI